MQTQQLHYKNAQWASIKTGNGFDAAKARLVILFGSRELIAEPFIFDKVRADYPNAEIISCSTAGEIMQEEVFDDTVTLTAVQFDKTPIECIKTSVELHQNSL